jgi:hypothetical protein
MWRFACLQKVIDLLKLDIELSEWITLEEFAVSDVLSQVRQLLLEFQLWRMDKPGPSRRYMEISGSHSGYH